MKKERVNEMFGVLLFLVGIFSLLCLLFHDPSDHAFFTSQPNVPIKNGTGIIGAYLSHYLVLALGFSSYSIPAVVLFWAGCCFIQKVPQKKFIEFAGILIAILSFASILSLFASDSWKVQSGGLLGYFLASSLERYFGLAGGVVIGLSCLCLSILLFTDFMLYPIFESIYQSLSTWFQMRFKKRTFGSPRIVTAKRDRSEIQTAGKRPIDRPSKPALSEWKEKLERALPVRVKKYDDTNPDRKSKLDEKISEAQAKNGTSALPLIRMKDKPGFAQKTGKDDSSQDKVAIEIAKTPKRQGAYIFPTLDLLNPVPKEGIKVQDDLHANSKILEDTLNDFGIEVKVMEIEQGPVITRYEILPAPGVKVTRILALADDIALTMKAKSVRFIAPIPGKSAIGVEIPNQFTTKVFLRDLMESKEYRQSKAHLPLVLGKDTGGKTMISDLSEMPHLLVAGTTGSGKTVCVNSVILGLVHSKTPDDLKFVMIDPKMVELAVYKDLPHMLTPVVTDVRKAAATLNWVVAEMERRYKIFAHCGTRNISSFNQRDNKKQETVDNLEIPEKMPYIVVVIDELADLMLVAQDKVEGAIARLAQLSRAVGIHLLLATQRPSVDVITGVIKANFPARISFKVASKVDSRTVLDTNGADKLLGKGDMLFLEPGQEKPIRGQACLVTDEEVNRTVQFLKQNGVPVFHPELQAAMEGKATTIVQEKDELYDEAVRVILETRQASTSALQRRLGLGYGRAARLIDVMEQEGIVGPPQGSKPREILVDKLEDVAQKK